MRRKTDRLYFRLTLLGMALSIVLSCYALYVQAKFSKLVDEATEKMREMRQEYKILDV